MSENNRSILAPAEITAPRSRRSLLATAAKGVAAMAFAPALTPIARAAGSSGRTLVCIQLIGGNDSNNMIVPLDDSGYAAYAQGRGELALPKSNLLAITARSSGQLFGLHPALSGLRDLYQQGLMAVIANIGQMKAAASKAQLIANPGLLPDSLYSHSRQEQVGYVPGGLMSLNWAGGRGLSPSHGVSTSAATAPKLPANLVRELEQSFPQTGVGQSLALVAAAIVAGATGSAYVCTMSGFETLRDQLVRQNELFTELNDALVVFHTAIRTAGLAGNVTAFTQTEFNRTLAPNASHGSAPAWGRHELVIGGAVAGGDVYGTFPSLQRAGADDLTGQGVWIPSTSEMQYSATLAQWGGIADVSSSPAFVGLSRFAPANLGFLAG